MKKRVASLLASVAVAVATAATPTPPVPAESFGGSQWLLPYQQRTAGDESRIVCVEKARRIGGTFAEAMRVAFNGLFGKDPRDVWFSSADESAAREFVAEVRDCAEKMSRILEIAADIQIVDGREFKVFEIVFPRGNRLTAMASNPKAFRSKGGDVILDEFAHHEQAEEMWKAAYPVITWGGSIRVLSTHNGEDTEFNRICAMGRRRRGDAGAGAVRADDYPVSLHTITIHDAVAEGLVERINALTGVVKSREEFVTELRTGMTLDAWEEEYECKPGSQAGSLLPYTLTRACVHVSCPLPTDNLAVFVAELAAAGKEAQTLYAGVDIGRTRDLFVLWVLAHIGGAYRTSGVLIWQGKTFGEMRGAGNQVLADRRVRRMCVDSTGLGMQLGEQWREDHGAHRVEDIQITAAVKEEIYPLLRRHVEERTIMLPKSDSTLADLASLRSQVTAAGKVRYMGERTLNGHADRACALALALHAADTGAEQSLGIVQPMRGGPTVL